MWWVIAGTVCDTATTNIIIIIIIVVIISIRWMFRMFCDLLSDQLFFLIRSCFFAEDFIFAENFVFRIIFVIFTKYPARLWSFEIIHFIFIFFIVDFIIIFVLLFILPSIIIYLNKLIHSIATYTILQEQAIDSFLILIHEERPLDLGRPSSFERRVSYLICRIDVSMNYLHVIKRQMHQRTILQKMSWLPARIATWSKTIHICVDHKLISEHAVSLEVIFVLGNHWKKVLSFNFTNTYVFHCDHSYLSNCSSKKAYFTETLSFV